MPWCCPRLVRCGERAGTPPCRGLVVGHGGQRRFRRALVGAICLVGPAAGRRRPRLHLLRRAVRSRPGRRASPPSAPSDALGRRRAAQLPLVHLRPHRSLVVVHRPRADLVAATTLDGPHGRAHGRRRVPDGNARVQAGVGRSGLRGPTRGPRSDAQHLDERLAPVRSAVHRPGTPLQPHPDVRGRGLHGGAHAVPARPARTTISQNSLDPWLLAGRRTRPGAPGRSQVHVSPHPAGRPRHSHPRSTGDAKTPDPTCPPAVRPDPGLDALRAGRALRRQLQGFEVGTAGRRRFRGGRPPPHGHRATRRRRGAVRRVHDRRHLRQDRPGGGTRGARRLAARPRSAPARGLRSRPRGLSASRAHRAQSGGLCPGHRNTGLRGGRLGALPAPARSRFPPYPAAAHGRAVRARRAGHLRVVGDGPAPAHRDCSTNRGPTT